MDNYIVDVDTDKTHVAEFAHEVLQEEFNGYLSYISLRFGDLIAKLTEEQAEQLRQHPHCLSVEKEPETEIIGYTTQELPSDILGQGLDRSSQRDLPMDGTYRYRQTGNGVTIYIHDQPARVTHVEVAPRAEKIGSGGNEWHGTAVMGIAAGSVRGIAKNATIKALSTTVGGVTAGFNISQALDWVIDNHVQGTLGVINFSWITTSPSSGMEVRYRALWDMGVILVAGIGNDNNQLAAWPAAFQFIISVGGTNANDTKNSGSRFGPVVDIFTRERNNSLSQSSDTGIRTFSGTSSSSPVVAGSVANLIEAFPNASKEEIVFRLKYNATFGKLNTTPNLLLYNFIDPDDKMESPDVFFEDTIWTVPAGVTEVTFECWGAGGTGFGGFTGNEGGDVAVGGGGGSYARKTVSCEPGQVFQFNVAPTNVWSSGGSDGADTSVVGPDSSVVCMAKGGKKGLYDTGGEGGLSSECVGDASYSGASSAINHSGGSAAGKTGPGEAPVHRQSYGSENYAVSTSQPGQGGGRGGDYFSTEYAWNTVAHERWRGKAGMLPGGGGSPAIYTASGAGDGPGYPGGDGGQGLIVASYQVPDFVPVKVRMGNRKIFTASQDVLTAKYELG